MFVPSDRIKYLPVKHVAYIFFFKEKWKQIYQGMQGQHSYNKRSSEDRLFESICSRRQRVRLNRPFGPENAPQAVSGMLIRTSQERRESPPLIPQSPELDDLPKTIFGHVIAFIGMARRSVDVYWFSSEH